MQTFDTLLFKACNCRRVPTLQFDIGCVDRGNEARRLHANFRIQCNINFTHPQHVQSINGVDVQYEDYATILKAIKSAGNLFTLEVSAEVVG